MTQREIDKNPQTPELSDELIHLLTDLCFRKDNPEEADVIFEFSTLMGEELVADLIKHQLDAKLSKVVIITGGTSEYDSVRGYARPEAKIVSDLIRRRQYPDVTFLLEEQSTDLRSNALFSNELFNLRQYERILFITKAHAAGRSYLTLKKIAPNAKLFQATYTPLQLDSPVQINPTDWFETEFGKSRVWGEYLRIKLYGERGDIELNEVKALMDRIDELTKN